MLDSCLLRPVFFLIFCFSFNPSISDHKHITVRISRHLMQKLQKKKKRQVSNVVLKAKEKVVWIFEWLWNWVSEYLESYEKKKTKAI